MQPDKEYDPGAQDDDAQGIGDATFGEDGGGFTDTPEEKSEEPKKKK